MLGLNLLVAIASLRDLGDSWRVGVIEEQDRPRWWKKGYTAIAATRTLCPTCCCSLPTRCLLQSMLLLALSCIGCALVHAMIRREEAYLKRDPR